METMEKRYMTMEVEGITIQVKMEDEGIVLDAFDKDDEVLESSYKFYDEFGVEEVQWMTEETRCEKCACDTPSDEKDNCIVCGGKKEEST